MLVRICDACVRSISTWQQSQPMMFWRTYIFHFRLYSEYKRGESLEALASKYSVGVLWAAERIEAARLSIETQVKIETWPQHG